MAKVVVLLSPTQRAKLLQIPDTFAERDITRNYSLSAEDLAVIEQRRRPQNRLGFTVQLAYLRFLGRPWDPQEQVPHPTPLCPYAMGRRVCLLTK
jgi:TnpA family transposase